MVPSGQHHALIANSRALVGELVGIVEVAAADASGEVHLHHVDRRDGLRDADDEFSGALVFIDDQLVDRVDRVVGSAETDVPGRVVVVTAEAGVEAKRVGAIVIFVAVREAHADGGATEVAHQLDVGGVAPILHVRRAGHRHVPARRGAGDVIVRQRALQRPLPVKGGQHMQ